MKRFVLILSAILTVCCLLLMAIPFLSNNNILKFVEFPIVDAQYVDIINGKIYLGSSVYGRMQVYDLNEKFLFGFFTGDRDRISLHDNYFHVINGIKFYRKIDLNGNLIETRKINRETRNELVELYPKQKKSDLDVKRNFFTNTLTVHIPNKSITINVPWYLYMFTVPFPFALYWVILGLSIIPIRKIIKKHVSIFFNYKPKYLIRR